MNDGLKKILTRIAHDPANKTLIDRYLILVRDLDHDDEKVNPMLHLARVLLEPDPFQALNFLHMILKYDSQHIGAMKLVAKALKLLNRTDKVEIVEQEIKKLELTQQNEKAPTPLKVLSHYTTPVEITLAEIPSQDVHMAPKLDIKTMEPQKETPAPSDSYNQQSPHDTMAPHQNNQEQIFREQFDLYLAIGELEKAQELLDQHKDVYQTEPWYIARQQIVKELTEKKQKRKEWEDEIWQLIKQHRYRYALALIQKKLESMQDMPINQILRDPLILIGKALQITELTEEQDQAPSTGFNLAKLIKERQHLTLMDHDLAERS